MINHENNQPDVNSVRASTAVFIQYYNKNIPKTFPQATIEALEKFQAAHPTLFKGNRDWTIDKHRKRLMDWLVSYKEEE